MFGVVQDMVHVGFVLPSPSAVGEVDTVVVAGLEVSVAPDSPAGLTEVASSGFVKVVSSRELSPSDSSEPH